jgi:hypothetical protein
MMEQAMENQTQILQSIAQAVHAPPQMDARTEFLKSTPITFEHTSDPVVANDWLKVTERKLIVAQCNEREKVIYVSGQLYGLASDWWDNYLKNHGDPEGIEWQEFKDNFITQYVPDEIMRFRRKEFLRLKQGAMTVSEYHDKFIQMSRYATEDVDNEQKKQELFVEGLNDALQHHLLPHGFVTPQVFNFRH